MGINTRENFGDGVVSGIRRVRPSGLAAFVFDRQGIPDSRLKPWTALRSTWDSGASAQQAEQLFANALALGRIVDGSGTDFKREFGSEGDLYRGTNEIVLDLSGGWTRALASTAFDVNLVLPEKTFAEVRQGLVAGQGLDNDVEGALGDWRESVSGRRGEAMSFYNAAQSEGSRLIKAFDRAYKGFEQAGNAGNLEATAKAIEAIEALAADSPLVDIQRGETLQYGQIFAGLEKMAEQVETARRWGNEPDLFAGGRHVEKQIRRALSRARLTTRAGVAVDPDVGYAFRGVIRPEVAAQAYIQADIVSE